MINGNIQCYFKGEEKTPVSANFKAGEFKSKGSGYWQISSELIQKIQTLRSTAGAPLRINSGYRGWIKNKLVGGAKRSKHLTGMAVDIRVPKGMDPYTLARMGHKVGIRRIGVANTFVHFDVADGEAYWVYTWRKHGTRTANEAETNQITGE